MATTLTYRAILSLDAHFSDTGGDPVPCDLCTANPEGPHTSDDGEAPPSTTYLRVGRVSIYLCDGHAQDLHHTEA